MYLPKSITAAITKIVKPISKFSKTKGNSLMTSSIPAILDEEIRPDRLSIEQLENFNWESYKNLKSINLCLCHDVSKTLIEILPKTVSKLLLNIKSTDLLDDPIWSQFSNLELLHINGPWDSDHDKVSAFYKKNICKDFTFRHHKSEGDYNYLSFKNDKWEFEYFRD